MTKNRPKVSIIIAVYNMAQYVKRAVLSCLEQTYDNIEVIVIDDGSTDDTLSICKSISNKKMNLKVHHQCNKGVSVARNYGIKQSSGDYIMFIDGDDYIDTNCVEKCIKIAEREKVDIVKYSYDKIINGKKVMEYKYSTQTQKVIHSNEYYDKVYPNIFNTYDFSSSCLMLIKTRIAKKILFNKYIAGEDYLFTVSCLTKSKSIFLTDSCLYHYAINEDSVTHAHNKDIILRRLEDTIESLNCIYNILGGYDTNGYKRRLRQVVLSNLKCLTLVCTYKEYKEAIKKHSVLLSGKEDRNILRQNMRFAGSRFAYNIYRAQLKAKTTIKRVMSK